MESVLQNYLKHDDLSGAIQSFKVYQGKAKNTGNIYYAMDLTLVNGFTKRIFFNRGEDFGLAQAFDMYLNS